MKTKPKVRRATKQKTALPDSDRLEHGKLRETLAGHEPRSYGDLRREFGLAPTRLEYELFTYPEIFEAGSTRDGRPTIRLRDGPLPSREDLLMRRQLSKMIKAAGATGIYLRTLYSSTHFESKHCPRLLAQVPEVQATRKPGSRNAILYKWVGEIKQIAVSPPAQSQPVDSAATLGRLVGLVDSSTRHLLWLENFLPRADILRTIEEHPELFETEEANLGQRDLLVRLKQQPELAHEQVLKQPEKSGIQDYMSSQANEVPSAEYDNLAKECSFKPACPGMALSRNPRVTRGALSRVRKPLVKI